MIRTMIALLMLTGCPSQPCVCFTVTMDRPYYVVVDNELVDWRAAYDVSNVCVSVDEDVQIIAVEPQ